MSNRFKALKSGAGILLIPVGWRKAVAGDDLKRCHLLDWLSDEWEPCPPLCTPDISDLQGHGRVIYRLEPTPAQTLINKALTFAGMVRLRTKNYRTPDGNVVLTASEAAYIARGIEALQMELNTLKAANEKPPLKPRKKKLPPLSGMSGNV